MDYYGRLLELYKEEDLIGEDFIFDEDDEDDMTASVIDYSIEDRLITFDEELVYTNRKFRKILIELNRISGEDAIKEICLTYKDDTTTASVKVAGEAICHEWPLNVKTINEMKENGVDPFNDMLYEVASKLPGSIVYLPTFDVSLIYFKSKKRAEEASQCIQFSYYLDYLEEDQLTGYEAD